jgi:catechol 2,3-dioxygenase-like lactoylglutathione lyase family enzyme
MVHVEIPAGNTAKAREFWGGLFGWEFQEFPGSPTEYHMARFSETQGGAIMGADGDKRGPRVYFDVDDINAGRARVGELGGDGGEAYPVRAWAGSPSARTPRGTSSVSGRPIERSARRSGWRGAAQTASPVAARPPRTRG